ncbi:hypothetical protein TELCIR_09830 [Teladorsagia circumcincta]|uniref:Uncharacterized protein n=1 Tax=Teladorsagia circumcincta TaxID=45464 RepID=A0A2G9UDR2_TELCI|nr:hypothetical protein TELCIR_09830 [Teladorsagia circumcincta]
MSEVESLTEGLTQIGREAAALKTEFPSIQSGIEAQIKADMERIVRDEKYIRDQTAAVDQSLRRCKALANIMVTMKKLAMVQDPTIQRSKKMSPTGIPPRPPSRYSVQDVRMKFQKPPELPEQIKNLMEEVARRGSPAPESSERRIELEERQERLAEKQRQLLSQFQQLQQMTPLP